MSRWTAPPRNVVELVDHVERKKRAFVSGLPATRVYLPANLLAIAVSAISDGALFADPTRFGLGDDGTLRICGLRVVPWDQPDMVVANRNLLRSSMTKAEVAETTAQLSKLDPPKVLKVNAPRRVTIPEE